MLSKDAGKQVMYHTVMLGCDPELFFERGGQIIGAERVIAEEGLAARDTWGSLRPKAFVLDGVQVELNPGPNHCRANMGNELKHAFRALRKHLQSMEGITASFRSVVEVSSEELDGLSDKSKILGCAPSLNLYDHQASISVDPTTYRKRSAGGHIHIGLANNDYNLKHLMSCREELVPLMDCLVGLPSVLVDRDPGASERRQVYGRAGEYRLPAHGLEYRTLSNFWLRSYQLMSFVMGLTRLAVSTLATRQYPGALVSWDAPDKLLSRVDLDTVREAINTNDLELARRSFLPVKAFILEHVQGGDLGLNAQLLDNFEYFAAKVAENGLEHFFPQDPLEHWSNLPEGHSCGWETFLQHKVSAERQGIPSFFTTVYK